MARKQRSAPGSAEVAARLSAIRSALEARADAARVSRAQANAPTATQVLGTPVPAIREVVKEHARELRAAPAEAVLTLARALVAEGCLETRQVAYELIGGHRETLRSLREKQIEALGAGIDNWRSVDVFATEVAGPAWREGQLTDAAVHRWVKRDDSWWRRAALVSSFSLNARSRGGRGETDRTLRLCEEAVDDRNEMVAKALSWALREVIPWDRKAVERFLHTYEARLHRRVVREVRSKLDTGLK